MSKNNLIILIFSFIVSFFASYESKKYKLEVYFGNNLKNYYQIENMYKFKNDDMIFDYAASENFKVIIYTNNLDKAEKDVKDFIISLNFKMRDECHKLKNIGLFDEFDAGCRFNSISTSVKNIYVNNRFDYLKFTLIFLNLFLILSLVNVILLNIKLNKKN